jgi:parvulin-like peptidyl-prolyl isomerase
MRVDPAAGRIAAALAAVAISLPLAACGGGGLSPDTVARVGGVTISKAEFDHWLRILATSQASGDPDASSPAGPVIPQPPDFKQCIAARQAAVARLGSATLKLNVAQLKVQCRLQYERIKTQVMQFLISAQWIQSEAAERGVQVSPAEVDQRLELLRKSSFPNPRQLGLMLKTTGQRLDDLRFRLKIELLSTKLREKEFPGAGTVTQAQIAAYYVSHRASFGKPEIRNLRVVITRTHASAERALAALRAGQSWGAVSTRYSRLAAPPGGLVLSVAKGQQPQPIGALEFAARPGTLVGPVKTPLGYEVFQVLKVIPGAQQTLAQATPQITSVLSSQTQRAVATSFLTRLRQKWLSRTVCRAGFVTPQYCRGTPKRS